MLGKPPAGVVYPKGMIDRRDFLSSVILASPAWAAATSNSDWRHYAGDSAATRFSPLETIKRSNVKNLKVAWNHACGDASLRPATTIECTPLVVGGVMYLTTPRVQVRAVNAATGEPIWNFNPPGTSTRGAGVNRGVTWFEDGKDRRVFAAIRDKLHCLNPQTGDPMKSFGDNGVVDLTTHFDRDMTRLTFRTTSPPVVFEDTVIVSG